VNLPFYLKLNPRPMGDALSDALRDRVEFTWLDTRKLASTGTRYWGKGGLGF